MKLVPLVEFVHVLKDRGIPLDNLFFYSDDNRAWWKVFSVQQDSVLCTDLLSDGRRGPPFFMRSESSAWDYKVVRVVSQVIKFKKEFSEHRLISENIVRRAGSLHPRPVILLRVKMTREPRLS